MAKYNKKKRSFVAGIISFIGSIVLVWGLYLILSEAFTMVTTDEGSSGRIILGILIIVFSAFIQYGSFMYDKFREHRKWVKRLYNAGIVEELPASKELAWQAYRSNPTPMGLSFIEEHNPKAAAEIRKYLADNPVNPLEKLFGSLFGKISKKPVKVVDEPVRIAVPQPAQKTASAPVKKPAPPAEKKVQPANTAPQKAQPAKPAPQKTQPVKQTEKLSQETQVIKTAASEVREEQPVRKLPALAKDKHPPKKTFTEKVTEKLNVIALAVIKFFKQAGAAIKAAAMAALAALNKGVQSVKKLIADFKAKSQKPSTEENDAEETINK